ncbi:ligand-binding sensor domain-containing protein [Aurantibacillus circumpalustris]|uniref:ligand-binding sensor domain-containing protein n=1 Tax=Aurantibacillus circumpalustris TaxID=3036359 RepID=UPI00295ADF7F|nr:two-component regulator propeller domain-containing protein [Aurantibacillus circumpalustris]
MKNFFSKKQFIFFLFIICHGLPFNFYCQKLNYKVFQVNDGLPQSTVYEIFQDFEGFLWLGTDGGGVCRYDGFRFKTYGSQEGLTGNVVRKICQDKEQKIWVATNNGVFYLENDSFQIFKQIPSMFITSVFLSSTNEIWVSSSGKGVYRITKKNNIHKVKHYDESLGLAGNYVFDIAQDKYGKIWIPCFGNGISILDPTTDEIKNYANSSPEANEIICLKHLSDGNMVSGTKSAGAIKLHISPTNELISALVQKSEGCQVWSIEDLGVGNFLVSTDKFGVVASFPSRNFDLKSGLPTNNTFKIFRDKEKNLWIGTSSAGLVKYVGDKFIFISKDEISNIGQVSAIVQDKFGQYWIGNSSGLRSFSFKNGKLSDLKSFSTLNGLPSNELTCLMFDSFGRLWIGTRNGLCYLKDGVFKNFTEANGLINMNINALIGDSKNRIWIGTSGGLNLKEEGKDFVSISETGGLVNNEVQTLFEDKRGDIWIGTLGGIVKFDGEKLQTYDELDGLSEIKVQSINADSKGNIYAGTFGGGIFRMQRLAGMPESFKKIYGNGQPINPNIFSLTFLNDSILLAGSNKGLHKFEFKQNSDIPNVSVSGKDVGFVNPEISFNAILKDNNNQIWFGTTQGITIYNPALDRKNLVVPTIHISSVKINGIEVNILKPHILKHFENSLRISFNSVSLTYPTRNEYFAKLVGFDTTFVKLFINESNLDEFCTVEYNKLQSGNYKLLLKSTNNDGVESETASFQFQIEPPIYQTKAFILCVGVLAIFLIIIFIKLRERKLIQAKEKLEKIVLERTEEVVASKHEIEEQKNLLEVQQHEITDSINYSKRIQQAILPDVRILNKNFPDNFILYKPKDIVSGDFYYFKEVAPESFYLAVADCTGHGVPGAFMSLIGSKELAESIKIVDSPSTILQRLNIGVKVTLNQSTDSVIRDGMDIGLIRIINQDGNKAVNVIYAGANRPLWIIRKHSTEIEEIKATKCAIGGHTESAQEFVEHTLNLDKGDSVFMFSDGYADQFGGPSIISGAGKKMMTKRFREALLSCANKSMHNQKLFLDDFFEEWKGKKTEQVDDVLIIGIRL